MDYIRRLYKALEDVQTSEDIEPYILEFEKVLELHQIEVNAEINKLRRELAELHKLYLESVKSKA